MKQENEVGLSEDQITTSDFGDFVTLKGAIEGTIEPDKRFAIFSYESIKAIIRSYYSESPEGFVPTAKAIISGLGVEFEKFGRRIPGKYGFYEEKESLMFMRTLDKEYSTHYELDHLKGQIEYDRANNLSVNFDENGVFNYLSVDSHDGQFIMTSFLNMNELDRHFLLHLSPYISNELSMITEKTEEGYTVFLMTKDGKPHHKVEIPRRIRSDRLFFDLGGDKLLKKPTQPADGIRGESHGDTNWRYENFSDSLDIHVIPMDTPDGEEEFDRKGFRELLDEITDTL